MDEATREVRREEGVRRNKQKLRVFFHGYTDTQIISIDLQE